METLSSKELLYPPVCKGNYPKKDVKEFIKKLKERIQFECRLDSGDVSLSSTMSAIDKLAGENLI